MGLRDLSAFIEAGNLILQRENPYLNSSMRIGTLSSLLISCLDNLGSIFFINTVWQIVMISGFLAFAWSSSKFFGINIKSWPLPFLILWLSSVRENLVVNQATGFIALLLSIFLMSLCKSKSNLKISIPAVIVSALLIDFKPHLTLVPIIGTLIARNRKKELTWTFFILVLAHLVIDLYVGSFLEYFWVKSLSSSSLGNTNPLPDSHFLWPILLHLGLNVSMIKVLGFVVPAILAYSLVAQSQKVLTLPVFMGLFSVTCFSIYFHFYDFSLLAILTLVYLCKIGDRGITVTVLIINQLIMGTSVNDIKLQSISLALTVFLTFSKGWLRKKSLASALLGFSFSKFCDLIILLIPVSLRHDVKLTFVFSLVFVILFYSNKKYKSEDPTSGRKSSK